MGIPCKCLAVITINGIFFQQSGMCVRTWACMCTCMSGSMFYIMYLWIVPQHTYLHWHIHLFLSTYEGLVPSTLLIRVSKSKGAKFLSVRIWPCPFFLYLFISLLNYLLSQHNVNSSVAYEIMTSRKSLLLFSLCTIFWIFYFIVTLSSVCLNKVFLYSPGCLGSLYVEHIDFELTETYLPLPPKCWNRRHRPHIRFEYFKYMVTLI